MRGVPRWLAVLAVVATGAVVCAFTVRRAMAPATFVLQLSQTALPADGFTSTELRITPSNGRQLRGLQVTVEDPHRAAVESVTVEGDTAIASLARRCVAGRDQGADRGSRIRDAGDRVTHDARYQRHDRRRHSGLSCACTILPTALPSAAGLPCWRKRSIFADRRCRPRLTIAPRSCALPIARPCARTMPRGHARWRCRLRRRQATSSNINILTLRLGRHCSGCVVEAFKPATSAMVPSRNLRMWKRCGGTTRISSVVT